MSVATLPNTTLAAAYAAATPKSAELAAKARSLLPSGVAHDSRNFDPHPIYVARAQGPRKWDVDGNEYVDYYGGHGALLLGHNHSQVMAAAHAQLDRGTHFGACHELEVRWAELVCRLVPGAERVRFTSSGTEATLMALRLARAFTGRQKLVRVRGHFHGWHDHMTSGHTNHFDGTPTIGVLGGVAENVLLVDPNDTVGLTRLFDQHKYIAAAIVEPTGANFGRMPLHPLFIRSLRELTRASGALLIFDEVVTGFRVAPGGAQQVLGITADLVALAKILAGGLPGGAVAGRKDVLDILDFAATKALGQEKIQHPGTFNANPLSAAAGVTALEIIATTDVCARANAYGARMRQGMNEVLTEEKAGLVVYGTYSGFHIFTNPGKVALRPSDFDAATYIPTMFKHGRGDTLAHQIRLGLLVNGVDVNPGPAGFASATHGESELTATIEGFRATIRALKREGKIG